MEILGIDHVGLHVEDVGRSCAFYCDLLGFAAIERPELSFPGAWLRVGSAQERHLIGRDPANPSPPVERHWALEVRNLDGWRDHLLAAGLELQDIKRRPDGARQQFVRDPDGHVLELLERSLSDASGGGA